jgi:hypothetical protein
MTSMVLGDSTLKSLTPNLNASLDSQLVVQKTNFLMEPGWTATLVNLYSKGKATKSLAWECLLLDFKIFN